MRVQSENAGISVGVRSCLTALVGTGVALTTILVVRLECRPVRRMGNEEGGDGKGRLAINETNG